MATGAAYRAERHHLPAGSSIDTACESRLIFQSISARQFRLTRQSRKKGFEKSFCVNPPGINAKYR
jgi:hypothetical protein